MVREGRREVVVDTYAIIADLTGQASPKAYQVLDSIRLGDVRGIVHYLIVCELAYHWRRERVPFISSSELIDFIETYFTIVPFT